MYKIKCMRIKCMRIKLLVFSFTILSGYGAVNAQENNKNENRREIRISATILSGPEAVNAQWNNKNENRHEIRISASDGLTRNSGDIFGIALVDALLGTKREDTKSSGVYSLGYRYSINRFRIGSDVSFSSTSSKLTLLRDQTPSIKEHNLSFMVLPAVEFQYYKRKLVELYGSAAGGVDLTRTSYKQIDNAKNHQLQETSLHTSFAWQVSPIAIRVGNKTFGGFLEAGLGHKGFLSAGVGVKF